MPTVSVIVPVYKVEPWLRRCVDSILAQTYPDFELILVDDGSPDNCGDICDEYAAKDSRVHVIHQKNGGLSAARNAGIDWVFAHSDSRWLTFVDSDDWLYPETLQFLLRDAAEKDVLISICGFCEKTETSMPELSPEQTPSVAVTPEDLWCKKNVTATIACAKLYRKELFSSVRYPVGKIHEDEFVTYRLLFSQERLAFREIPFYCYYQNPAGITRSTWSMTHLAALEALEEQIRYFRKHRFYRALKYNLSNYVYWCQGTLKKIEALPRSEDTAKWYRTVRRKLRLFLLRYPKSLPYSRFRSVYELAFPRFFRVYHWGGRMIKRS